MLNTRKNGIINNMYFTLLDKLFTNINCFIIPHYTYVRLKMIVNINKHL